MNRIRAPYNFVPLNQSVYSPSWREAVSQDVPFEDGISALLSLSVYAETPIFVRGGENNGVAQFFTTPDKRFAIPGSSLRGALRNIVEIASFGKMSRVNNHKYGVRDLHNRDVYGQYMAEIRTIGNPRDRDAKKEPVPLVTAGWLKRVSHVVENKDDPESEIVAEIVPCHFAKIHYRMLSDLAQQRKITNFRPGVKQSSVRKYKDWGPLLDVDVNVKVFRPMNQRSQAGVQFFGDAGKVMGLGGTTKGRLVFTGQPADWRPEMPKRPGAGNPKQNDFVFYDNPGAAAFPVTRRMMRTFEFVHANRGQQNRMDIDPNEEWEFWKSKFENGSEAVPVFFLPEVNKSVLRSFGLAMMFRLAYKNSTSDLVERGQPEVRLVENDLAELIFGHVPAKGAKPENTLKGRVSIGTAVARGNPQELQEVKAVLGAPKASFYPNYVEQAAMKDPPNTVGKGAESAPGSKPAGGKYRTYMDEKDTVIRGWKRYRPFQNAELRPRLPPKASEKVMTRFRPLAKDTIFDGKIRVHNLRPAELGALVWAARLGGYAPARHTLGMARSLGFGRARIDIQVPKGETLRRNDGAEISLEACVQAFSAEMEKWAHEEKIVGNWAASSQIYQLLSCAVPFENADDGRHMMLDHPTDRNEFTAAKKELLALPPAGVAAERRALIAVVSPAWQDPEGDHTQPKASSKEAKTPDTSPAARTGALPTAGQRGQLVQTPARSGTGVGPAQLAHPPPAPPPREVPTSLPEKFLANFASADTARDIVRALKDRLKKGKPGKETLLPVKPVDGLLTSLCANLVVSSTQTEGFLEYFDDVAKRLAGRPDPFEVTGAKQVGDKLIAEKIKLP